MTTSRKNDNNIPQDPDEKLYTISFEKKSTKANIRLGTKLVVYLILAGISGAFFSNFIINLKYGRQLKQAEELINNEMVISDYTKIIDKVSPSLVTISNDAENLKNNMSNSYNTTGVILDASGNILTNYNTIKDFQNVYVKLSSVASLPIKGEIILKNQDIDLAIIKINYDGELKPIEVAKKEILKVGQEIAVLGNNSCDENVGSIVPGIITSTQEKQKINNSDYSLLQIDAVINKDNTGGPIVNSKGQLVGIASMDLSNKYREQGLYYGIELKELEAMVESTNAFKSVLGVNEGGILVDQSNEFKGFYVQEVDKNSAAYKAGIKPTDIILEIDEYEVISVDELTKILQNKKSGDTLKCKVLSDGEVKDIEVKIGS